MHRARSYYSSGLQHEPLPTIWADFKAIVNIKCGLVVKPKVLRGDPYMVGATRTIWRAEERRAQESTAVCLRGLKAFASRPSQPACQDLLL